MATDSMEVTNSKNKSETFFEQKVIGSRRVSNYVVASMVSFGGFGFLLASLSSYFGKNFLPYGNAASLIFIPQGLVMGLYGVAGFLLAIYVWSLVVIDFGSGFNRFDKAEGSLSVSRKGIFKEINIEIPLQDVKSVKLEIREGINPKRRIALTVKGRKDLPLTGIGQPLPLMQLEQEGAELARFLGVNLEGI